MLYSKILQKSNWPLVTKNENVNVLQLNAFAAFKFWTWEYFILDASLISRMWPIKYGLYYQDVSQELISFGILNSFTILVNSNRVWLFLLGFVFIEYMFLNSIISFILLDCSTTLSRVGSSYPSRRVRFLSQTIFSGNNFVMNVCLLSGLLSLKFTFWDLIYDEQFILHTLKLSYSIWYFDSYLLILGN